MVFNIYYFFMKPIDKFFLFSKFCFVIKCHFVLSGAVLILYIFYESKLMDAHPNKVIPHVGEDWRTDELYPKIR